MKKLRNRKSPLSAPDCGRKSLPVVHSTKESPCYSHNRAGKLNVRIGFSTTFIEVASVVTAPTLPHPLSPCSGFWGTIGHAKDPSYFMASDR